MKHPISAAILALALTTTAAVAQQPAAKPAVQQPAAKPAAQQPAAKPATTTAAAPTSATAPAAKPAKRKHKHAAKTAGAAKTDSTAAKPKR